MCNDSSNIGIKFTNNRDVVLKSLTITNCGRFDSHLERTISLFFNNVNIVTLKWVSVQNGSGFGLFLANAFEC